MSARRWWLSVVTITAVCPTTGVVVILSLMFIADTDFYEYIVSFQCGRVVCLCTICTIFTKSYESVGLHKMFPTLVSLDFFMDLRDADFSQI